MLRAARRDEAIDSIRTMFWFYYLARELLTQSARDVQRAISPMSDFDAFGHRIKNNKFLSYSRGSHVPSKKIIEQAAALFPKSAWILDHVLWKILRSLSVEEKSARQWAGHLAHHIQKAIVRPNNEFGENNRTVDMLMKRPCLDSLAALTIMFRFYNENPRARSDTSSYDAHQAWWYAIAIFRMLLMLGGQFLSDKVRAAVFMLYTEKVFHLVDWSRGRRFDCSGYDYCAMSAQLLVKTAEKGIYLQRELRQDEVDQVMDLIQVSLQ
ncbi:hypothetical protein ABT364_18875 [Massilia sp. SR12]